MKKNEVWFYVGFGIALMIIVGIIVIVFRTNIEKNRLKAEIDRIQVENLTDISGSLDGCLIDFNRDESYYIKAVEEMSIFNEPTLYKTDRERKMYMVSFLKSMCMNTKDTKK